MKIGEQESREMRDEGLRKGVSFDDRQWEHFIHKILEPRLDSQERIATKELARKKSQLEREHLEALEKSEQLQTAAAGVRDTARGYEELKKSHFARV